MCMLGLPVPRKVALAPHARISVPSIETAAQTQRIPMWFFFDSNNIVLKFINDDDNNNNNF